MLLVMTPALSIRRVSCISPPAMILLAWLLSRGGKKWITAAATLGALSLCVALAQIAAIQIRRPATLELPIGRVGIPESENYEMYRWMAEHTRPGQWYFGMPPLTLYALRNPTPIEAPAPGEFSRPEQIAAAVNGLERTQTPLLVLKPVMYVPHLLGYKADHLQPFQEYLYLHYRRTKIFPNGTEVWQRTGPDQPLALLAQDRHRGLPRRQASRTKISTGTRPQPSSKSACKRTPACRPTEPKPLARCSNCKTKTNEGSLKRKPTQRGGGCCVGIPLKQRSGWTSL